MTPMMRARNGNELSPRRRGVFTCQRARSLTNKPQVIGRNITRPDSLDKGPSSISLGKEMARQVGLAE
jgi:hypothetical protein